MLVAGAIGVVVAVTAGGLALGATVAATHRAAAAADLAALAAAVTLRDTGAPPAACSIAARVAAHNGATLLACVADAQDAVTVTCAVPTHLGAPGLPDAARRTARAGPDAASLDSQAHRWG